MDKKQSNATLNDKLYRPFNGCNRQVDQELEGMSPLECGDKKAQQPNDKTNFVDDSFTHQVHHGGVVHPNFDSQQTPLDPDRSLNDMPSPVPRYEAGLQHIMQLDSATKQAVQTKLSSVLLKNTMAKNTTANSVAPECRFQQASPWALIASPDLASHLDLLQVAGLIDLAPEFFEPVALDNVSDKNEHKVQADSGQDAPLDNVQSTQAQSNNVQLKSIAINNTALNRNSNAPHPNQTQYHNALLKPLRQMQLLDLSDIYRICLKYPSLNRYGINADTSASKEVALNKAIGAGLQNRNGSTQIPEMINDIFSPNWEVILYPERFDNGIDSLTTDLLACSVAVHILQQCPARKSINRSLSVLQICQHMRSYVLSQCNIYPQYEDYYRQIRLFSGHVIFAAHYLNFKVSPSVFNNHSHSKATKDKEAADQSVYINVSSRSSLFMRYPDISRYYINGWS